MTKEPEFHEGRLVLDFDHFCLGHTPEPPGCCLNSFRGERDVDKVLGVKQENERLGQELKAKYRDYEGTLFDVIIRPHLDERTGSIRYAVYYEHKEDKPDVDDE